MRVTFAQTGTSTAPQKLAAEAFRIRLDLTAALAVLGGDTLSGVATWSSDPTGLVFSSPTTDSATSISALATGGTEGTDYIISALQPLTSGQIIKPVGKLPVVDEVVETRGIR